MKRFDDSKTYSVLILVLSVIIITCSILDAMKLTFTKEQWYIIGEYCIQCFFMFDFLVRMIQAHNGGRWRYFRTNICDLFACLSFTLPFTLFHIPRVIHILHISKLMQKTWIYGIYSKIKVRVQVFFNTNGLIHVIYSCFIAVIVAAILVFIFESRSNFPDFTDCIWWSCETITTVGYGDFIPKTAGGRTVAVMLMVIGVGMISMLSGTIATYFFTIRKKNHSDELTQLYTLAGDLNDDQLQEVTELAQKLKDSQVVKETAPTDDDAQPDTPQAEDTAPQQ